MGSKSSESARERDRQRERERERMGMEGVQTRVLGMTMEMSGSSLVRMRGGPSTRRGVPRRALRGKDELLTIEKTNTIRDVLRKAQGSICTACVAALVASSAPSAVAETRLPPLDNDPTRCEKAFDGNTLGMANGLSDKLLDFRFCDLKGVNLAGKTLSAALMSGADFSKANLQNAVLDRVEFKKANLKGVNFINAVITGITWDGADLTDAVFDDALISVQDVKNLCNNPTLQGDSR